MTPAAEPPPPSHDRDKPRRVILESPFAPPKGTPIETWQLELDRNLTYARACLRDSLLRGEAPIASHLLYTQPGVLDDTKPAERTMGIEAGLLWGAAAEASVVYLDRGMSDGMRYGVRRALDEGRPIEFRTLYPFDLERDPRLADGMKEPCEPGEAGCRAL